MTEPPGLARAASDSVETGASPYLHVAVPLPVEGPLTYRICAEAPPPVLGGRVLVPVGRRRMAGVVWGFPARPESDLGLKEAGAPLDATPLLPPGLMAFIDWVSGYYFHPLGRVLEEALPPGLLSARAVGVEKILNAGKKRRSRGPAFPVWPAREPLQLTGEQEAALQITGAAVQAQTYQPILLHGVTGSGKTEVYLRAAAKCLEMGRSVLMLVPEIAMTAQTVGLFLGRFGEHVAVLHSGLASGHRLDQWWSVRKGERRCVVGTRSAIFSPLPDLGLIIVDEEHDPSYKQDERLPYQARDLAILRASKEGVPILLGSATPSVSTYSHALSGRYRLVALRKRVGNRGLPEVVLVDRRSRRRKQTGAPCLPAWMSAELHAALQETLDRGEQSLLFLNRRGFATYVFCEDCGHTFRCPQCEITLTWHRGQAQGAAKEVLRCHYCGRESAAPPVCPDCHGTAVKASGFGTERVAEDVAGLFPGARVLRLDRDAVQGRKKLERLIQTFHAGEADVLVGTQMVTKGHDFPGVTLVGVLWADHSLNFPEYHASERTFQLLAQVAGRAGRGERPGKVLVQSWFPEHFGFTHLVSHDFEGFFGQEIELRRTFGYPPYGRLINVRFSGSDEGRVEKTAMKAADMARQAALRLEKEKGTSVEVLGPSPAPRAKIRGTHRWQILLKSASLAALRQVGATLFARKAAFLSAGVRFEMDVDPHSLL